MAVRGRCVQTWSWLILHRYSSRRCVQGLLPDSLIVTAFEGAPGCGPSSWRTCAPGAPPPGSPASPRPRAKSVRSGRPRGCVILLDAASRSRSCRLDLRPPLHVSRMTVQRDGRRRYRSRRRCRAPPRGGDIKVEVGARCGHGVERIRPTHGGWKLYTTSPGVARSKVEHCHAPEPGGGTWCLRDLVAARAAETWRAGGALVAGVRTRIRPCAMDAPDRRPCRRLAPAVETSIDLPRDISDGSVRYYGSGGSAAHHREGPRREPLATDHGQDRTLYGSHAVSILRWHGTTGRSKGSRMGKPQQPYPAPAVTRRWSKAKPKGSPGESSQGMRSLSHLAAGTVALGAQALGPNSNLPADDGIWHSRHPQSLLVAACRSASSVQQGREPMHIVPPIWPRASEPWCLDTDGGRP